MDTTAEIVGILADALGCPVSTEIPLQRPSGRYVGVSLDNDMGDMFLMRPRYSLMCWGSSDVDAHGLAVSALHALAGAAGTHPYLSDVSLDSMARDEWGNDGQARYLLTVDCVFNII